VWERPRQVPQLIRIARAKAQVRATDIATATTSVPWNPGGGESKKSARAKIPASVASAAGGAKCSNERHGTDQGDHHYRRQDPLQSQVVPL
jgi:hypothetical protein